MSNEHDLRGSWKCKGVSKKQSSKLFIGHVYSVGQFVGLLVNYTNDKVELKSSDNIVKVFNKKDVEIVVSY